MKRLRDKIGRERRRWDETGGKATVAKVPGVQDTQETEGDMLMTEREIDNIPPGEATAV